MTPSPRLCRILVPPLLVFFVSSSLAGTETIQATSQTEERSSSTLSYGDRSTIRIVVYPGCSKAWCPSPGDSMQVKYSSGSGVSAKEILSSAVRATSAVYSFTGSGVWSPSHQEAIGVTSSSYAWEEQMRNSRPPSFDRLQRSFSSLSVDPGRFGGKVTKEDVDSIGAKADSILNWIDTTAKGIWKRYFLPALQKLGSLIPLLGKLLP